MQNELSRLIDQHVKAEPIVVNQFPNVASYTSSQTLSHEPKQSSRIKFGILKRRGKDLQPDDYIKDENGISQFQTQASGYPSGSSRDAKITIYSQQPQFGNDFNVSSHQSSQA
jgi:hypothetical protein